MSTLLRNRLSGETKCVPARVTRRRHYDQQADWRFQRGAISKPVNSKPGATVQPTRVHAPSDLACCQTCGGITCCGRSPAVRLVPRVILQTVAVSGLVSPLVSDSSSGAPAYQCQTSAASTLCQCEMTPCGSRK